MEASRSAFGRWLARRRRAGMVMLAAAMSLGGTVALSTPASATVGPGVWSCSGIPAGAVSLEMDYYHCDGGIPGNRVSLVANWESGDSAWICGWGRDGLDGTISDDFKSSSSLCRSATGWAASWHIVKL